MFDSTFQIVSWIIFGCAMGFIALLGVAVLIRALVRKIRDKKSGDSDDI